jgi:hypothetical protein
MTICVPPTACCCEEWTIAPGLTLPLYCDWSLTLAQLPGYKLVEVAVAALTKIGNPNVPAPSTEIELVSGLNPPPSNPWPGYTEILSAGTVTLNMIDAADAVTVGNLYRLDLTVYARDCDGRTSVLKACVSIYITSC